MGGGTVPETIRRLLIPGPSPRGRGHPRQVAKMTALLGAIPAWAGAPAGGRWPAAKIGGHPRVGGGTVHRRTVIRHLQGPSPRGRGHPDCGTAADYRDGAIPAWAGAPPSQATVVRQGRGHPRVGGGTQPVRGRVPCALGPSPRGRGHRTRGNATRREGGAIPAWAGAPTSTRLQSIPVRGHPRVGGGTEELASLPPNSAGPSPRGRGHRPWDVHRAQAQGAIPAWAGAPQKWAERSLRCRGHPRVGGGTYDEETAEMLDWGPSPRGRGHQRLLQRLLTRCGAIPAWAGAPVP